MDILLNDEIRLFRDQLRRFVETDCKPITDRPDYDPDVPHDPEVMKRLRMKSAQLGFWGAHMPEALGGGGLGHLAMVALREASCATGSPLGFVATPGPEGPTPVLAGVTPEQQARFVDPLMHGETTMAFGLTEPGAGSDAQSIQTRADKVEGGYVINGRKHFITNGQSAAFVLLFAVTDKSLRAAGGISAFLIPQGHPGFSVARLQKGSIAGTEQAELVFEDCRVPESLRLGDEGFAFITAMQFLASGRLGIAAYCLGLARYALDLSLSWAKDRKTFGKPIANHQAIGFMLAEMATDLEAARGLVYTTALRGDAGEDINVASSMCKLQAAQMCCRVVDSAVQIHGGMGWMREHPVERLYRLVRMFRIVEGTDEIQKLIISRGLLG
jgi:alkylation response protein AidB-like acyl-CoA dehydrogenase